VRKALATWASVLAVLCAGCGTQQRLESGSPGQRLVPGAPGQRLDPGAPGDGAGLAGASAASGTTSAASTPFRAHPQAIEPIAGAAPQAAASPAAPPAEVSAGPTSGNGVVEPVSDAVIRRELQASGLPANLHQAALTPSGLAIAPVDAPYAVQQVIKAGNEIAHLPYRFGGGHGTFEDNAYDCSGSLSFVFAAAGLLDTTVTSGQLMSWGDPGPGRWITVFAAPGHTFMYVAGLRFDTVALAETGSRWSNRAADEPDLSSFDVRHPVGL